MNYRTRDLLVILYQFAYMDVAMKNIFNKLPSKSYGLLVVPILLTIGGFALNYSAGNKSNTLSEIKYGVNLCFTRLTQSVIALQSHDYFSKHLERSYIDFTNECFFEFKEKVAANFANDDARKFVDQLLDDSQIFSKALINVLGKRQTEINKSIIQAQILPAYSKVDFSRFNLNQWIKKQESTGSVLSWQNILFISILIMLNALIGFLVWNFHQVKLKKNLLEAKADDLINETDFQPHRLEVFLAEILDKYGLNKSQEVLKKYSESLISQSQILAKMKSIKETNLNVAAPNAAVLALESDEWQTKDMSTSNKIENIQPPIFIHEDKLSLERHEIIATTSTANPMNVKNEQAAVWTEEDEDENILEDQTPSFTATNEPLCTLGSIIDVAAKNLTNANSMTTLVHHASNAPFLLKGDHEHFEQLFIALVNKIEQRFKEFSTPSELCCLNVDFDFDTIISRATITFTAKKAMFHIDDLEYFHDQDHLTVDSYNIIIREMVKELYGEITFKNHLGDNLDDNSLQITLIVPAKHHEPEIKTSKIIQLVKGKKKHIQKNMNKEITI